MTKLKRAALGLLLALLPAWAGAQVSIRDGPIPEPATPLSFDCD